MDRDDDVNLLLSITTNSSNNIHGDENNTPLSSSNYRQNNHTLSLNNNNNNSGRSRSHEINEVIEQGQREALSTSSEEVAQRHSKRRRVPRTIYSDESD